MNRIFIHFLSFIAFSTLLFSCSSDKVEPANMINDPEGANVKLTWTVNGGQTAATTVDLDLFLKKGTNESNFTSAGSSKSYNPSETITLTDGISDGTYVVQVHYFSGTARVEYKLDVTGVSTNKTQSFSGYFESGDQDLYTNFIKIVKTGTAYRVERFNSN